MTTRKDSLVPRLARRRRVGLLFAVLCACAPIIAVGVLVVLVTGTASMGWSALSWKLLTNFPSTLFPEKAGMKSALAGTAWLVGIAGLTCIPVGVAAAVYLEEYAAKNRLTRIIELNIANLAGVPSIVYGILGLTVFVRWCRADRSVLAGGMTLGLLVLPVIIIATREALSAVPRSIRAAAFALGATRWQTVRSHVLPAAVPGIMTGVILALSRALGEAAPLLVLGGLTYVAFVPQGPLDAFTAMPLQIFAWCSAPQPEFHRLAAAGILLLLGMLLPMNALAAAIRAWQQGRSS